MFNYELGVIILMLILNAIFTAYEMGLATISRSRIAVLVNDHKKGATDAAFMKDRMEASLAVIQLGVTLFTTIAAAAGGAHAVRPGGDQHPPAHGRRRSAGDGLAANIQPRRGR